MATNGTITTGAGPLKEIEGGLPGQVGARIRAHLDHFIRLARKGQHSGASGGEKRAARLARAVVDDMPGLDAKAVDGLIEFIRGTAAAPWLAQYLIDG